MIADEDPFRLGFRFRTVRLPDGRTELRQEPLTAADLLDPQLGDYVDRNSWHVAVVHELWDILSWRYEPRPDVFVSCDLKMLWRIRGLPNPSPDVAVCFYTSSLLALLTWWLDHDPLHSAEEMDAMFKRLALPGLRAALGLGRPALLRAGRPLRVVVAPG